MALFPLPASGERESPRHSPVTATIVLVTHDSAAVIGQALASLPNGAPAIVVDNASTDDSAAIAERHGSTVIQLPTNVGFGMANNAAVATITTPYVLFLNPDATLRPGCLEILVAAAERRQDAALLTPTILKADGTRFEKWSSPICAPAFRPPQEPDADARGIAFASGAAVLARTSALRELGGFDPAIFLFFEDDDLSRRVLDRGWSILHVPAAIARHAGNASSPVSERMVELKHWHLAWSERHVRRKHGLPVFSRWRVGECAAKLVWARLRRDRHEAAKQRGLLRGTLAALRGIRAQDVREHIGAETRR